MKSNTPTNKSIHLIWGAALVIVGVAVFFRIPEVMPRLAEMGQSTTTIGFVRICFYLIGIVLIGGGIKKFLLFINAYKSIPEKAPDQTNTDQTGNG